MGIFTHVNGIYHVNGSVNGINVNVLDETIV